MVALECSMHGIINNWCVHMTCVHGPEETHDIQEMLTLGLPHYMCGTSVITGTVAVGNTMQLFYS